MGSGSVHVDEYAKGKRMICDSMSRAFKASGLTSDEGNIAGTEAQLEAFGRAVQQEQREAMSFDGWAHFVRADRERIAQVVENMGIEGYGTLAIAAAIRMGMTYE